MRRRHATSPGFSGLYRDLGIPSRKRHESACKLILSVGGCFTIRIHVQSVVRNYHSYGHLLLALGIIREPPFFKYFNLKD